MKPILPLVLLACFIAPACIPALEIDTPVPVTADASTLPAGPVPGPGIEDFSLPAGYGARGPWFELYFTDPTSPLASQLTGGVDGPLVEAINAARLSVDMAAYSLSLNSIRDALRRANDRGVRVRLVMESDNRDRADPQTLLEAGIPVLGDRREGLMHDKFVVIDNSEVWTGSMNFTDSGAYQDNNNLMHIHSVEVAEDYTREFEEMFVDDHFGPDQSAATPKPRVILDGVPLDIYFSPDDSVQASLLDLVDQARESLYFMAYSFTADPLGDAIRLRAANGVQVSGVMEAEQVSSNIGTEFDAFVQAGLDVRQDGNPGLMHHKVLIIDEQIVVFGSYNFTNSAETRNDENLIVVYSPEIALRFLEEFRRVADQAAR
jgi:phosphatidylserine/phosphatidylglycerophosphate/cardiolipin synthase-like enzyme